MLTVCRTPWAAAGFEDTELGVNIEPEVDHGTSEVYAGVQACGCEADQGTRGECCAGLAGFGRTSDGAARLGDLTADPQQAFPAHGQMKPEQADRVAKA